jgi:hypothetical protein
MKHKAADNNLDFDGMAGTGVNRSANRYAKNQHTGHSNDGRLVNVGMGPRTGNHGSGIESGHTPPAPGVPALPAQGSVRDSINRGAPNRGPGGVMCKSPANPNKINVGQGPRKGNQQ